MEPRYYFFALLVIMYQVYVKGEVPPLIDSLIITSANEEVEFERSLVSHDTSKRSKDVTGSFSTDKRDQRIYHPGTDIGTNLLSQSDSDIFPSVLGGLDDSRCPKIHCFIHKYYSTSKLILDCKESELENETAVEYIDCLYRMSPTSPLTEKSSQTHVLHEGRGYDLKVTLTPSPRSHSGGGERRVAVDYLANGVLGWVVEKLRRRLRMLHSPVHLILPFIQFTHVQRVDIGDLSTKHRVTRLSLWNPFRWDEDSLIPTPIGSNFASYVSPKNPSIPPYFRLNVFCDHANRKPSFKRLWLPWESWQVRFNHCQGKYGCLAWLSPYAICDSTSQHSFMPSYFIMPLMLSDSSTLRSTATVPEFAASKYKPENEILFENQCRKELTHWDPVGDLVVDQALGCWKQNVAADRSGLAAESDSVLFLENPAVASRGNVTPSTLLPGMKPLILSSFPVTTTPADANISVTVETSFPIRPAPDDFSTHFLAVRNQTTPVTVDLHSETGKPHVTTTWPVISEHAGLSTATLNSTMKPFSSTEAETSGRTESFQNASLPWFMHPFIKHHTSDGRGSGLNGEIKYSKETSNPTIHGDAATVRKLTNAVIFLSVLVIVLMVLLLILLSLLRRRHRSKRPDRVKNLRGFSVGSKSDETGYFSANLAQPRHTFAAPIATNGCATAPALTNDTFTSANSLPCGIEPSAGAPILLTFGSPHTLCMENEAYSCATERKMMSTDTDSTSTTKSYPCLHYNKPQHHLSGIFPPVKINGHTRMDEERPILRPFLTKLKKTTKNASRKQHTLVFEDGEISEDKLPEGLRHSYSLINK